MANKKLAIVGSAEGRENAPFEDVTFDIWVFNEAAQSDWCKRWDACFQMHPPAIYTGHNTKNPRHWEWLQGRYKNNQRIIMQHLDTHVPNCTVYPLGAAKSLIGGRDYLASTVCYALALALLENYAEIHIYGVELSASEYKYQAECYRFWVGFAMAQTRVVLHSGEALFQAPLYGYDGNFAFGKEYFLQRATFNENKWGAAEKNLTNIKSKMMRYIERKEEKQIPELVKAYYEAAIVAGQSAGALAEAERYSAFGDRGADRGGFEFAAATSQREGESERILMYTQLGKVEYVFNVWAQTKSASAEAQMRAFIAALGQKAYDMGAHLGMYQENLEYILKYDATAQANGQVRV